MNPWLYLVQSTTQVILHISTSFKDIFLEIKEFLEFNKTGPKK